MAQSRTNGLWDAAIIAAFVGSFLCLVVARLFFYRTFDIPSAAMEPTLSVNDYLLANIFVYRFTQPQRGDVIIFYSSMSNAYFVKRVVGLPGETIQMKDGKVLIDGISVPQRRVADWIQWDAHPPYPVPQYAESLPGGRVVHVLDRETEGPEDNTDAFVVPADAYFVLGDNRDNSDDSRTGQGFVARKDVFGRAEYKFITEGRPTWQPID